MILLGLGSNMGDRAEYLRRARAALEENGIHILRASSLIETPALLTADAPHTWNSPFLNQVLVVETKHTPQALLAFGQAIERQLGREKRGRWSPRIIDIDVLAYGEVILQEELLTVPHPGIAERDFVLKPLAEIAPEWRHPATGKTASEMLA